MKKLKAVVAKPDDGSIDGSHVLLSREDGTNLKIHFAGNLDLYFNIYGYKNEPELLIGKDNYEVYMIFDQLYYEIMHGLIKSYHTERDMILNKCEMEDLDYHEHLKEFERKYKIERFNNILEANELGIIKDECIKWSSDDFSKDVAPYFEIIKLENAYKIVFGVPKYERDLTDEESFLLPEIGDFISVRIRNNGSSNKKFNVPFMRMYKRLLELSNEYSQIHIEEYFIDERMKQGEDLQRILTRK